MLTMDDEIGLIACEYMASYGSRALDRIRDDISKAIGSAAWDSAHRLHRAQMRVRRYQLCEQMAKRAAPGPTRYVRGA